MPWVDIQARRWRKHRQRRWPTALAYALLLGMAAVALALLVAR